MQMNFRLLDGDKFGAIRVGVNEDGQNLADSDPDIAMGDRRFLDNVHEHKFLDRFMGAATKFPYKTCGFGFQVRNPIHGQVAIVLASAGVNSARVSFLDDVNLHFLQRIAKGIFKSLDGGERADFETVFGFEHIAAEPAVDRFANRVVRSDNIPGIPAPGLPVSVVVLRKSQVAG